MHLASLHLFDSARRCVPGQNVQNTSAPDHFWKFDVEKVHAVWREASQNVQNKLSDHFWKLRCRKSARRCGAKHICQNQNVQNTLQILLDQLRFRCEKVSKNGVKYRKNVEKCAIMHIVVHDS